MRQTKQQKIKGWIQVWVIILLALAICFAGCTSSKQMVCYNNKAYLHTGTGYHQEPPILRFKEK
jgi:hypothetical protein